MIVSNAPLISNCNNNTIISCCHVVYIAFVTTLIASSIDLAILLSICSSRRSPYSFVVSERRLHIVVSITLSIILNKTIGLYTPRIYFAFCDLPGLARIMTLALYRHFGKYSYTKLMFVILAMMVARGLPYIFRNPINK